jgi:predicted acylesterase/phospholipase RssA
LISSNKRGIAALALLLLALAGCAHYPLNEPLVTYQPDQGYRFPAAAVGNNTHSLFVCLAFSGGGTRAASLAYGVMEKLRATRIVWKGVEKSLLDEVDCISSVSGGSFTAAYYGLFGDRLFSDFRPNFLERDIQGDLTAKALSPLNWLRLASPNFSRIDLAAEHYDEVLFGGKTFGDVPAGRPFIMLNATNLANGDGFEFTQEQFDFLGSDVSRYPVARAVAASSAFPVLLSPLSLKNYPSPSGYRPPTDITNAQEDFYDNRRRYQWARNRASYLTQDDRPYVHLMDGGLADNIGLRAIENAYLRTSGFIRKRLNEGEIEKFLIIVVNARTQDQEALSRSESPPGLFTVAYKTATISLDNFSFETIEFMKELQTARKQTQTMLSACQQKLDACPSQPPLPKLAKSIEPYVVEVNFEALPDPARRQYFLGLPTTFALPHKDIHALIEVGQELLGSDPAYQAVVESLRRSSP